MWASMKFLPLSSLFLSTLSPQRMLHVLTVFLKLSRDKILILVTGGSFIIKV